MKARRSVSLLLCVIMMITLFSACSKSDVRAFYFAVSSPADTFDPTIAESGTARLIVRNCFEGLTVLDENGGVLPGAAENWTVSDDGLKYTFYLRPGAKWHITSNAREELKDRLPEDFAPEVTAYDFEFGLKRALDPAMGCPDAVRLSAVAGAQAVLAGEAPLAALGIKALSDLTLEITLSRPQNDFTAVLSEPMCMPCNEQFFNAAGGRYGLFIRDSMSNGAFYLSYFDESAYRITKNPDYTGLYAAKADVIRFYVTTDEAELFDKLKNGDYSGAYMDEAQFERFGSVKKTTAVSVADKTRSFILNANSEALADPDIRKAFVLATDTAAFAALAEKTAAVSPVPPAAGGEGLEAENEYAPEKAAELLNAALEASGKKSVTVTLKCEERFETLLKKQLQSWQKIFGTLFVINVTPLSSRELGRDIENGNYDIAFYTRSAPLASEYSFFSQFVSGAPGNAFGTENPEFDDAVAVLGGADGSEKSRALKKVNALFAESSVLLPAWNESTYFICAGGVSGIKLLPGGDSAYFYACTDEK